MLFGDLAPFVRPMSRWLATAGWFCTLAGLAAGFVKTAAQISSGMAAAIR